MSAIQKIKGFADLFPPDSELFTMLETAAREVFGAYGAVELRTPILERTELFARGIGDETDVVQKEMYTFTDRGDRSVTLRPEATAGVVRAAVESGVLAAGQVRKYFTAGPMFRYERPQKGRMRQFHQINLEAFGSDSPLCDAEVMLMLAAFLRRVGLAGLAFEVNSLGCPECRPMFHVKLREFLAAVDKDRLCADCLRRMDVNPLRVLDCKVAGCKEAVAGAPSIQEHRCGGCRGHFDAVLDVIGRAGLAYTVNPRLVRGLDYYVRTTFEVTSTAIGAQSAVAGGGRYDGLAELLGGPKVPGIGFAVGMERLALLLKESLKPRIPDFYLAVLEPEGLSAGLLYAEKLRALGLSGEVALEARKLKKHLQQADKLGAATCLILGPDELAAGTVVVKDLASGRQTTHRQDGYLYVLSREKA